MTYAEIMLFALTAEQTPATPTRRPRQPRREPRKATRGGRGGETRYAINESYRNEL